jgi:hypothetical protein
MCFARELFEWKADLDPINRNKPKHNSTDGFRPSKNALRYEYFLKIEYFSEEAFILTEAFKKSKRQLDMFMDKVLGWKFCHTSFSRVV